MRPVASYIVGGRFDAVRQSANNAWNVNLSNGNMNNNNTNNRYNVVGASESLPNVDEWIVAEHNFYKNKHGSPPAQRIHIHPARVLRLARRVASGEYSPRPGYRFPIIDPTPREIYAAFCEDRLVHHYVAPFISQVAERVHAANGDVSHGNRIGHSAQTGAGQIRDAIAAAKEKCADPYVVKIDIRSFFSSVPRVKAYEALARYAGEYYGDADRDEKLAICKTLITHDPTVGCVKLPGEWEKVPARKLMENAPTGCGLPIGNFYSQLVANLYLASYDAALSRFGVCPRFVDDKCCIVDGPREAQECLAAARDAVEAIGLRLHPDKVYIQPAHRGVNYCGRTVKGGRIYLSNRTVRRAHYAVGKAPRTPDGARKVCATVNSYLGLMRHCTERKNERRLADAVLSGFGPWVYFEIRDGHFVCKVKAAYNLRRTRIQTINKEYDEIRKIKQERQRHPRERRGRR